MSEHTHEHIHNHEHEHRHEDGQVHTHEHTHAHTHEHGHDHGQSHEHTHHHLHDHDHEHTHSHDHVHSVEGGKDVEILNLLLDHWVSHNQEHAKEYKNWMDKMNAAGQTEVAQGISEAIALMAQADEHLLNAKKALVK